MDNDARRRKHGDRLIPSCAGRSATSASRASSRSRARRRAFLFAEATPERLLQHAWLKPHFLTGDGKHLARSTASSSVAGPDDRGRHLRRQRQARAVANWHMRKGRFLQDLAEAGIPPETIDTVLCTHLHVDHVGWNTMLGRRLGADFSQRALPVRPQGVGALVRAQAASDRDVRDDSVRPVMEAGLADLVETDHRLTHEVWLEPAPGHTPGHVSVRIQSDGQAAVITGDLMHHPIQCAEPDRGQLRRGCRRRAENPTRLPQSLPGWKNAGAGDALRGADRRAYRRARRGVRIRLDSCATSESRKRRHSPLSPRSTRLRSPHVSMCVCSIQCVFLLCVLVVLKKW